MLLRLSGHYVLQCQPQPQFQLRVCVGIPIVVVNTVLSLALRGRQDESRAMSCVILGAAFN